jgi:hypothetical protein
VLVRPHPAVKLCRLNLKPVPIGLLFMNDIERDNAYIQLPGQVNRDLSDTIGNHRYRTGYPASGVTGWQIIFG